MAHYSHSRGSWGLADGVFGADWIGFPGMFQQVDVGLGVGWIIFRRWGLVLKDIESQGRVPPKDTCFFEWFSLVSLFPFLFWGGV